MMIPGSVTFLSKYAVLLRKEYEAEKAAYFQESGQMGLGRKVRRGMCWYPAHATKSYYNSLNQLVVELVRTEGRDIEHSFEHGRPVCFFHLDEGKEERQVFLPVIGTVSYVDEDTMVVALPGGKGLVDITAQKRLGIQLYFDETTYRLMFEALNKAINADKGRLAELREIFYGDARPGRLSFSPLDFPWLNSTQEKAVNEVLRAKDVAILHGPPGTGKTTTMTEAIYETLKREDQVLVCAQSNMAVDWISEKLADHGIPVLRIGNPTRVNDKMLSFTYERKFEAHPDYASLWAIRKAIREMRASRKEGSSSKIRALSERAQELEERIHASLFDSARAICCTLAGSASKVLSGKRFSSLFIDEAGQALDAACWIAIRKAGRVILAGDHQQLPPTVKCPEAEKEGLGTTLMMRMAETKPECVTLLEVQYRMNDAIMRFSSDWFYEGKLRSDGSVRSRSILDLEQPIEWIDTGALGCNEEFVGESYGRINREEAELSIGRLRDYLAKIGRERVLSEHMDVGLISPYRAQVQYLRQMVARDAALRPYRRLISINTVDGFQGQERDIIIISLVRANETGEIGFLRDLRRMNVAMTRARMKLIILGSIATLGRNRFYRRLHEYIEGLKETSKEDKWQG